MEGWFDDVFADDVEEEEDDDEDAGDDVTEVFPPSFLRVKSTTLPLVLLV